MSRPEDYSSILKDKWYYPFIGPFIRYWTAGAICFFIGFGTPLGMGESSIDFIFFMTLALGLVEIFLLDYIIEEVVHKKTGQIKKSVLRTLLGLARTALVMGVVITIYGLINLLTPLLVEPYLFGLFYLGSYHLVDTVIKGIKHLFKRKDLANEQ